MGIRYDFSAAEILKQLGYLNETSGEILEKFMEEKKISLPEVYCEFMSAAMDCPLLETSDIWVWKMIPFVMKPYFFYEEIEQVIEDQKENWEKNPQKYADNIYHIFYQLPGDRWQEKSCDYLKIGSDYGAGIVCFGIRRQDLGEEDPPVYMNHEADPITVWKKMYERLSDYLLEVVLTALACVDYSTAQEALEEEGWEYLDYEEYEMESAEDEDGILEDEKWQEQMLAQSGIDLELVKRVNCAYGGELFFCQDEGKECFYLGRTEEEETTLTILSKEK